MGFINSNPGQKAGGCRKLMRQKIAARTQMGSSLRATSLLENILFRILRRTLG